MEKALRYNDGKPQWSLVHYNSLIPMIRVLEYGAEKYSIYEDSNGNRIKGNDLTSDLNVSLISSGRDNWKKYLDKKQILESLQRHLAALMDGEENDPETGLSHMGHIQCNAMFYNYHYGNEGFEF